LPVPLLVVPLQHVFSRRLGTQRGLVLASMEAAMSAAASILQLSDLPPSSISAVKILPTLRTEAGDEVSLTADAAGGTLYTGIQWLAEKSPPIPCIECHHSLEGLLSSRLQLAWEVKQAAMPGDYVELYNVIVQNTWQAVVGRNRSLPWPPREFCLPKLHGEGCLPCDWNDESKLQRIEEALAACALPAWTRDIALCANELAEGEASGGERYWIGVCLEYALQCGSNPGQSLADTVQACVTQFRAQHSAEDVVCRGGALWASLFFALSQDRLQRLSATTDQLGTCYADCNTLTDLPQLQLSDPPVLPKFALTWDDASSMKRSNMECNTLAIRTPDQNLETPEKRQRRDGQLRPELDRLLHLAHDPWQRKLRELEGAIAAEAQYGADQPIDVSTVSSNSCTSVPTVASDSSSRRVHTPKRTIDQLLEEIQQDSYEAEQQRLWTKAKLEDSNLNFIMGIMGEYNA